MLFRRELVMFGPREVLLTSEEPVVKQFLNGRKEGPIGMSRGEGRQPGRRRARLARRRGRAAPAGRPEGRRRRRGVPPQIQPSPGLPERRPSGAATTAWSWTCCTRCRRARRRPCRSVLDQEEQQEQRREAATTPAASRLRAARRRHAEPAARAELMASLNPTAGVAQAGRLFALFLDVGRLMFRRPFQFREFIQQAWFVASVTIIPDRAGLDPVRRGHRAADRQPVAAGRRPVVHRRGQRAGDRARSEPDRGRAADRRRRRLGHLRRPRQPQDPRRDRRDGGARHLAGAAPGRAPRRRLHAGRGRAQRPGLGGRRRGRLLLQRRAARRNAGRVSGQLLRAGPVAGRLRRRAEGVRSSGSSPRSSRRTRASTPAAARRASATR